MAGQGVLYQPVLAWLLPEIKRQLKRFDGDSVWVSDRFPDKKEFPPQTWIVVRDDGPSGETLVTQDRMITVVSHANNRIDSDRLAEYVAFICRGLGDNPDLPACRVTGVHGPVNVQDDKYPYLRLTNFTVRVTGQIKKYN